MMFAKYWFVSLNVYFKLLEWRTLCCQINWNITFYFPFESQVFCFAQIDQSEVSGFSESKQKWTQGSHFEGCLYESGETHGSSGKGFNIFWGSFKLQF